MAQRRPAPRPGETGKPGQERVRTFVAVPVDEAVRQGIARWQARLAAPGVDIKWVEPHNLHITLAFLGELERAAVARVEDAVVQACAGHRPFTLGFNGFGVFPDWRAPRVLWIGADQGAEELTALARSVCGALRAAGLSIDDRPYRPHLTVGRWRTPRGANAVRAAVAQAESGLPPCRLDRVDVMASRLTPHGPVYTAIRHVTLGEAGAPGDNGGD
ncbi:MAG TPA: RNA 2',3'-cyclic phosphodiesterase [Limnochordales bacterium]